MRLLIDSTQVPLARTGVGIYAEHLIEELALLLGSEDTVFVLIQSDDRPMRELVAAYPILHPIVISSALFRNRAMLGLYEQCVLPLVALLYRIDLIHSLHYTFPLICPSRRVVTIHDLTFSLWPKMHTRARRIIMPFFTKMALRRAEGVLFVSDSTRKDAEQVFGVSRNMRCVIPLGVEDKYFLAVVEAQLERTILRLGIDRPYVLFLGTLEPRKNVIRLVQAFELVGKQHTEHLLVIVGGLGWHYEPALQAIDTSPLKGRIRYLGYISESDKIDLIAGCDLLAYPSLYEGFGLPVLEGMAVGVPVVTSNISSLPEVAGDAAILIDPTSVEQIVAAIDSVLSDEIEEDRLRKAGRERAGHFSWKKTAELTYAAYRTLVANSGSRASKS